jgi:hypothetical protein
MAEKAGEEFSSPASVGSSPKVSPAVIVAGLFRNGFEPVLGFAMIFPSVFGADLDVIVDGDQVLFGATGFGPEILQEFKVFVGEVVLRDFSVFLGGFGVSQPPSVFGFASPGDGVATEAEGGLVFRAVITKSQERITVSEFGVVWGFRIFAVGHGFFEEAAKGS